MRDDGATGEHVLDLKTAEEGFVAAWSGDDFGEKTSCDHAQILILDDWSERAKQLFKSTSIHNSLRKHVLSGCSSNCEPLT